MKILVGADVRARCRKPRRGAMFIETVAMKLATSVGAACFLGSNGLPLHALCKTLIAVTFLSVSAVAVAATDIAGQEFFEKSIRPLFVERCYECHSAQSKKLKGGLKVDTLEDLLKGGDTGPAIVAGDAEASLLIKAVRWSDPDVEMPPKNKLKPEQIAALEKWVKMGAPHTGKAATPAPAEALSKTNH